MKTQLSLLCFILVCVSQVRMSIEYGILPLSPEAFLKYSWIVCITLKEDFCQAYEWDNLALLLAKKLYTQINPSNRGRIWFEHCGILAAPPFSL